MTLSYATFCPPGIQSAPSAVQWQAGHWRATRGKPLPHYIKPSDPNAGFSGFMFPVTIAVPDQQKGYLACMDWTIKKYPRPYSAAKAETLLTDLNEALLNAGLTPISGLGKGNNAKHLLMAIFGNSPFLTECIFRDLPFADRLFKKGPDHMAKAIFSRLTEDGPALASRDQVMALLRQAKSNIALLVAVADIAGHWQLEKITGTLSRFAEMALKLCTAHLIRDRMVAGDIEPPAGFDKASPPPATPDLTRNSGFIVLGMGKLGAYELNYSSDIDLIVLYDADIVRYRGSKHIQDCFIRVTQNLVRMMQDRTGDGYVFRTDLRLRPDPGATAIALSAEAAEIYYQSIGLNWERSAMIKARPVAGDIEAGFEFLERLRGFVWRKNLDYAALEDIHAIKNQIHSHHHHGDIQVAGQDIKLGRGGIREIEFFAQIHQLIAGGRERDLQVRDTIGALKVLAQLNKVDRETVNILTKAYCFLRTLEHRLQMINDKQTHTMPKEASEIAHVACFMGFDDTTEFEAALIGHLTRVHACYDGLLAESTGGEPSEEAQSLGFDPAADDETTHSGLKNLGFTVPGKIVDVIQNWHLGRYRACRTPRARKLLETITPSLLLALGETADPDATLMKFDDFLKNLPSGVQLFSLIQAHPWLLTLLAEIMGMAPALAQLLGRRPQLLDAVLSPDFFSPLPGTDELCNMLQEELEAARDFQDIMDISRRWMNENKFRIGVQLLRGTVDAATYSMANTNLADAVMKILLDGVQKDFASRHGTVRDGKLAVLGMGKLGGRELTFTSDLDLVFIYRHAKDAEASDGPKPLSPSHYFARLGQSFITSLTAMTGEGRLYEVDMRLRPSGNAGPIAVSLEGFCQYQHDNAWTWEHLALLRARVCAGPGTLSEDITREIHAILAAPHDPDKVLRDAADMRRRLAEEFGTDNPWAIKHSRGGLVDIEFICQYLQLKNAAARPDLLTQNTFEALTRLTDAAVITREKGRKLREALTFLNNIQALLRLCVGDKFVESQAPKGLQAALTIITGSENFKNVRQRLDEAHGTVISLYQEIIEQPAAKLRQTEKPTGDSHA